MAVHILDMAKGYLTDAFVSRASGSLHEDPETIHKSLTGALPVVLAGMMSRSNDTEGRTLLASLIERFVGDTSAASSTDDPDELIGKGSGLIDAVFGANVPQISGALAQFGGVKSTAASGLLSMAGAIMASFLGRQLMSQTGGVSATNLVDLLHDQREGVVAAMPTELTTLIANVPGAGGIGGWLGGLSGAASSAVTGAASALGAAVVGATGTLSDVGASGNTTPPVNRDMPRSAPSTPAYSDSINDQPKGFNFWPWLLGALAIGLLVYLLRGCDDNTDTATISTTNDTTSASVQDATANMDSSATTAGAVVDAASSSIAAAADSAAAMLAKATAALGSFAPKKLPDGVELTIPANGIENKLIAFIEDQSNVVDKTTWFNFDRLLYETNSATLKPESREQLQNIAAILKAYPAVTLKIGGYTDNTGNAAANKTLSQSRAESAVAELVRLGVDPARLEAEGYGQEHPVASNKTEEGRAQNRRTAARVTRK